MTLKLHASGSHVTSDLSEVEHAIRLFMDPAAGMEIRVLPGGRSMIRPWGDIAALAAFVEKQSDYKGVYYTINPVLKGTGSSGAASNSDILNRRWLMIDVDPVKAEGAIDLSATDGEHDLARMLANRIVSDMIGRGWPLPVVIDSGNGWHLMYRIDLPNDELSRTLCREALRHMATMFECPTARVDRSVHNASRIAKLPGTWARKGPNTPDRPHRLCRIVSYVDDPRIVTIDQLKALTPIKKPEPTAPAPANGSSFRLKAPSESGSAYAKAALKYELRTLASAPEGGRNEALNKAAFALGQFVPGGHLDRATVEAELAHVADLIGLDEAEIKGTIRSGIEAGIKNPRTMPEPKRQAKTQASPPGPDDPNTPLTVKMSKVTPLAVQWLMQNRIPKRFITVMAGRTGIGKSFVACDLIARISCGGEIPFSDGAKFAPGGTLIISEDSHEYVLAPRLIDAEANMDRIHAMTWAAMGKYNLGDTEMLTRAVGEVDGGVSVVLIDPPTNFLEGTDEHKNSEVRQLVMRVVEWALERDLAVLFILHVNKNAKGIEAINRVMGSVAWVTTSRIAHTFCPDPEDGDRGLWVPLKNNLGPRGKAIAYKIVQVEGVTRVEWCEEVDTTADDAMSKDPSSKPTRKVAATVFIEEFFKDQSEVHSTIIWAAQKKTNVSANALKEAKDEMGIIARQVYDTDGAHAWVWRWPVEAKRQWQRKKSGTDDDLEEGEGVHY